MEIGPLHNNRSPVTSKQPETIKKHEQTDRVPTSDSLEVSLPTRTRLASEADAAHKQYGPGDMPANKSTGEVTDSVKLDRIKLAMVRARSGFYDQPHIREQIADRLSGLFSGDGQDNEKA